MLIIVCLLLHFRGIECYELMVLHKVTLLISFLVACHVSLFLVIPYFILVCNLFAVDYHRPSCDTLLNGTRREENFLEATFHALQVWSLTQLDYVLFTNKRMTRNKCIFFYKHTIKVCDGFFCEKCPDPMRVKQHTLQCS